MVKQPSVTMVPDHGKPWSASPMTMIDHVKFNHGQFDSHQIPSCHLTKHGHDHELPCSLLYSMVVRGHLTIIFAWDHNVTGSVNDRVCPGRPRLTLTRGDCHIMLSHQRDRFKAAIQTELRHVDTTINASVEKR